MTSKATREPWSRTQNEALVADYLDALELEITGQPFNKAARNRAMQEVTGRTRGAIELKLPNISHVMRELGLPIIDGYQPRSNVQDDLYTVVPEQLGLRPHLLRLIDEVVVAEVAPLKPDAVSHAEQVEPPHRDRMRQQYVRDTGQYTLSDPSYDYVARDAANRELGRRGEELVVALEHQRLWTAGHKDLAERIDHVSRRRGDGFGYDIHSFEISGADRIIEVKTTRFGLHTQFFVSSNEVRVSREIRDTYHLFRVFRFGVSPKYFVLPGSLADSCILDPTAFRAAVR